MTLGKRCWAISSFTASHLSVEAMPATSQAVLISQLAGFMRQLHDLPVQLFRHCNVPALDPLAHLTSIICCARAAIWRRLPHSVPQYYEDLLALYTGELALQTYQPALLHGDLSPEHFLADMQQVRLTGIIDWGDACVGDPAWDLVYICEDYGPTLLHALLERYAPQSAHLLERKLGIYQQLNNVDYCLSMLAGGNEAQIREALAIVEKQAGAGEM